MPSLHELAHLGLEILWKTWLGEEDIDAHLERTELVYL